MGNYVAVHRVPRYGKAAVDRVLAKRREELVAEIRTSPWEPKFGRVYFIGSEAGPIKIGFAKDVARRLAVLQNMSPVQLALLAEMPGPITIETDYHRRFAAHRLHGEWFERVPEILDEIERLNSLPSTTPAGAVG